MEPELPPAPLPEVVLPPHPQHRAHPREAVEHDRVSTSLNQNLSPTNTLAPISTPHRRSPVPRDRNRAHNREWTNRAPPPRPSSSRRASTSDAPTAKRKPSRCFGPPTVSSNIPAPAHIGAGSRALPVRRAGPRPERLGGTPRRGRGFAGTLAELHDQGRAPVDAVTADAEACFPGPTSVVIGGRPRWRTDRPKVLRGSAGQPVTAGKARDRSGAGNLAAVRHRHQRRRDPAETASPSAARASAARPTPTCGRGLPEHRDAVRQRRNCRPGPRPYRHRAALHRPGQLCDTLCRRARRGSPPPPGRGASPTRTAQDREICRDALFATLKPRAATVAG